MSLPGKLCIGILEEDNPLKAYFRFRPLLVDVGGKYAPWEDTGDYPDSGCIRIVPDKNESFHFKTRMRRMGLFCVIDLRAHPDENDKIRPNKNYRPDGPEKNAFIIYSDVVLAPAPDTVFEILSGAKEGMVRPTPRTQAVLSEENGALLDRKWTWEAVEGAEGQASLHEAGAVDPSALQRFELPGFSGEPVRFAILPAAAVPCVSQPIEFPHPPSFAEAPVHGREGVPQRVTSEANMVTSSEEPVTPEPRIVTAPPKNPENGPVDPKTVTWAAPASEPPAEDKPWIHRDESMRPQPVDPRLSPAQRLMAAQAGLNPRQGRSLKELIDDKWNESRLNQLGHPVQPLTTGAPVISPVEAALSAVRHAWNQPGLRDELLGALSGLEEFGASLAECREAVRKSDIEAALNDLEARRLEMLNEQDKLIRANADIREKLKQEICQDARGEVAEALKKAGDAKKQRAEQEALAGQARKAAADARAQLDAFTEQAIERRVTALAVDRRILERVDALRRGPKDPPMAVETVPCTAKELAERVRGRFEEAGTPLDAADAANLAACLIAGRALILSGPAGCGKTRAALLLADALGWRDVNWMARFAPGTGSLEDDERIRALLSPPHVPAMALLDDANLSPAADPLRGLAAWRDDPDRRLCLTVQDGGFPLPGQALDSGFLVRLKSAPDAPWQPPREGGFSIPDPVRLSRIAEDLRALSAPVPAACLQAMDALRRALAQRGAALSHRALGDSWRYCAAMAAILGGEADPGDIFDRAVAQRLLPSLLASAPAAALAELPHILRGLPRSLALLDAPLPVRL